MRNEMKKIIFVAMSCLTILTGCETPGQNVYDYREAGQSVIVEFGTVVDVRPIKIKGPNSGVGAGIGAVAGAGAGSQVGSGDGAIAATIGGAVIGAVAGAMAEQALQDQQGLDYTIVLESGKTITVSQYYKKDEPVIAKNARVMVQTSGSYQRVLPADHLPEQIKRPKGIKVVD
jgi:outer membrane lipoprotein SlyB